MKRAEVTYRVVSSEPPKAQLVGQAHGSSTTRYTAPVEATFYNKALRNETRRASRLLAAGVLTAIVGALRYADGWPVLFRLP